MRTPPDDITDNDLRRVLADHWDLTDVTLTYAAVGFGSHHWIATVAGDPAWFVTVDRRRAALWTALETAASLRDDARLPFVIAPEWGDAGELLAPCGAGHLASLTRFLPDVRDWPDGATATPAHHRARVDLTVALHDATDDLADEPWPDDFAIEARVELEDALARVGRPWTGGLYAEGVRGRLRAAADGVRADLAKYDTLVRRVQARDADHVVTHGELKPGNLLVTPDGPALVDWDTTLLAPPERDLWRLADAGPGALDRYTARSGRTVDPDALELYRRRWDLTDIALYVDELQDVPTRNADTDIAWRALRRLLANAGR